jgi:hypothetical protein
MLFNVLFWFYAEVALVYISELFGVLLTAYCLWRLWRGEHRYLYASAVALAICGGIKLSAMVFLAPLALYVLAKAPVKGKPAGVILFFAALAAWLVPFLFYHGTGGYISSTWQILTTASSKTSPLLTFSPGSLLKNLRTVLMNLAIAFGLFHAIAVPLLFLLGARKFLPPKPHVIFGLLWFVPYSIFLCAVHIGNSGYAIVFVPAFCMLLSYFYDRNISNHKVLGGLILAGIVASILHFAAFKNFTPEQIGAGKSFGQKSWSQRILAQANLLVEPTYDTIAKTDRKLDWTIQKIQEQCPDLRNVALVVSDDTNVNWRKAQYYFPDAISIRIDGEPDSFYIAQDRKYSIHPGKMLGTKEVCKTFWLIDESHPVMERLRLNPALHREDADFYRTTGAFDLELPDGRKFTIH